MLVNLLAGLILAFEDDPVFGEDSFTNDAVFRLVLGVISLFVGFIKTMPDASGGLPFLGDFLPVVSGFFCGAVFVLDYMKNTSIVQDFPPVVNAIFFEKRKIAGLACLAIAVLHFIIPQIVIF